MKSTVAAIALSLGACRSEPKFYCPSVGNEVARECLQTKERCEKGRSGKTRACSAVERAYCFSKHQAASADSPGTAVYGGEREPVCTPTREQCEAWVADYDKRDGARPSGCILASHEEIWP